MDNRTCVHAVINSTHNEVPYMMQKDLFNSSFSELVSIIDTLNALKLINKDAEKLIMGKLGQIGSIFHLVHGALVERSMTSALKSNSGLRESND